MAISIRFRLRSLSQNLSSLRWIYCRIRVNGEVAPDFATKISTTANDFEQKLQKIKGRSPETFQKNEALLQIRADIVEIYNELRRKNRTPTAQTIKAMYLGKDTATISHFVALINRWIADNPKHLDTETLRTYESKRNVFQAFCLSHLKHSQDIAITDLTDGLMRSFQKYLLKQATNNTMVRYMQAFERILNYGIACEWVEKMPFSPALDWKKSPENPNIKFLTEAEVAAIANCAFFDNRLQRVADLFVFQCWSGLNYSDLLVFEPERDIKIIEGREVMMIRRAKNDNPCLVPLFSEAKKILVKYNNKLPAIITNQKMNAFLKEIQKIVGLNTTLTTKIGRKTIGTNLLSRGVKVQSVSHVLGHSSVQTTEKYYAKLLPKTLLDDLKGVE